MRVRLESSRYSSRLRGSAEGVARVFLEDEGPEGSLIMLRGEDTPTEPALSMDGCGDGGCLGGWRFATDWRKRLLTVLVASRSLPAWAHESKGFRSEAFDGLGLQTVQHPSIVRLFACFLRRARSNATLQRGC